MRIRLMIDIEHPDDVADLAALTHDQPVVRIVTESSIDRLYPDEILFTGRFMGATPVEGAGE